MSGKVHIRAFMVTSQPHAGAHKKQCIPAHPKLRSYRLRLARWCNNMYVLEVCVKIQFSIWFVGL